MFTTTQRNNDSRSHALSLHRQVTKLIAGMLVT